MSHLKTETKIRKKETEAETETRKTETNFFTENGNQNLMDFQKNTEIGNLQKFRRKATEKRNFRAEIKITKTKTHKFYIKILNFRFLTLSMEISLFSARNFRVSVHFRTEFPYFN